MFNLAIALILRPIVALIIFGLILLPIRLAVTRFLPAGAMKRLLLLRVDSWTQEKTHAAQDFVIQKSLSAFRYCARLVARFRKSLPGPGQQTVPSRKAGSGNRP